MWRLNHVRIHLLGWSCLVSWRFYIRMCFFNVGFNLTRLIWRARSWINNDALDNKGYFFHFFSPLNEIAKVKLHTPQPSNPGWVWRKVVFSYHSHELHQKPTIFHLSFTTCATVNSLGHVLAGLPPRQVRDGARVTHVDERVGEFRGVFHLRLREHCKEIDNWLVLIYNSINFLTSESRDLLVRIPG